MWFKILIFSENQKLEIQIRKDVFACFFMCVQLTELVKTNSFHIFKI